MPEARKLPAFLVIFAAIPAGKFRAEWGSACDHGSPTRFAMQTPQDHDDTLLSAGGSPAALN
jgi:hypothetical protein